MWYRLWLLQPSTNTSKRFVAQEEAAGGSVAAQPSSDSQGCHPFVSYQACNNVVAELMAKTSIRPDPQATADGVEAISWLSGIVSQECHPFASYQMCARFEP